MRFDIKAIIIGIGILAMSMSAVFVEDIFAATASKSEFPYIAEVIGKDVSVRAGKGSSDYGCGWLSNPARVQVVGISLGYAKILPPKGSFSWIHESYVKLNPLDKRFGTVVTERESPARVWAGSETVEPMRSHVMQCKLNSGATVELQEGPDQNGDYYKIKPPVGAFLYINTKYLRKVGPVVKEPIKLPPRPGTDVKPAQDVAAPTKKAPAIKTPVPVGKKDKLTEMLLKEQQKEVAEQQSTGDVKSQPVQPPKVEVKAPAPVVVKPVVQTREMICVQQCYDISKKIDSEVQKPLDTQDYSEFKAVLAGIEKDKQSGQGQNFARVLLQRIERYELVLSVSNELKAQDEKLNKLRSQIEKNRQEKLSKLPKRHRFIKIGVIMPSDVYTGQVFAKRYVVRDSKGKVNCYAKTSDRLLDKKIATYFGKQVGLVGQVVDDPNSIITLIDFTGIEVIE